MVMKRDGKCWRVFATIDMMDVPVVTDKRRGANGVDLNADHLGVFETDAGGNYVNSFSETGACSATPAGAAETPTQSGSGCRVGRGSRGGLNGDRLGVLGWDAQAEPSCTVGAAAGLRPRLQEWLTIVCN